MVKCEYENLRNEVREIKSEDYFSVDVEEYALCSGKIHLKWKDSKQKLRAECARNSSMTMARLCPYCEHKIEVLARGNHGYSFVKCPNCGESLEFDFSEIEDEDNED